MARPDLLDPALAALDESIRAATRAAGLPETAPELERPRQPEHGDWATTVALRLAGPTGRRPRELADEIVERLRAPDAVGEVSVAGPGFINFRLAHRYHRDLVHRVLSSGPDFGRSGGGRPPPVVNAEFVSANPTGPLHVGAGRWAATGDAIAALLEATGCRVVREYYVNDAGEQIRRFAASVVLTARGEPLGEEHYRGAVIGEIADELAVRHGDGLYEGPLDEVVEAVAHPAVEAMRRRIETVLHAMGVDFDVWFSERDGLHATGAVEDTIAELERRGVTYEHEGARFLRTTDHGDDKDRVLVRADGRPTYFAADCAYLRDKAARADRLFYLLGADHHGYVDRLRAAAACLGIDPGRLELRIGQLVNLLRGGEPVRMSKRAGETVDLDEVLDEVGVDVLRYHFLRQSLDTTVDFDLAEVARRSMDNPVYYVQYAHVRINSLLRAADERGFDPGRPVDADLALLTHPAELDLLAAMARLPLAVAEAAELRATQRLARYAEELAGTFHRFYTECRVLAVEGGDGGDDPGPELGRARYWLATAARQALANVLGLLRVSAPERL